MAKDRSNWHRPVKKMLSAEQRKFLYDLSFKDNPSLNDALVIDRIARKIVTEFEK